MRITRLNLAVAEKRALQPKTLTPLGPLVVLAGPNGAGKSRILDTVKELLSDRSLSPSYMRIYLLGERDANYEDLYRRHESFQYEGEWRESQVFEFFPTKYALSDHRSLTPKKEHEEATRVTNLGTERIEEGALAYISKVMRRAFTAKHPEIGATEEEKKVALAERESLKKLFAVLLDAKLEYDLNQQPTLFGRPIPDASLSRGQTILLQLVVALHAQGVSLDGSVLLMDEPENHLHPSVAIEVLSRLRELNPTGQLWVATHSIPLLAAMPSDSIWYVSEGGASWAGRRPELVLNGLLGGEEGCERVAEFLRLPAQLASNRFASECLLAPQVAETGPDDPQALQLREFLEPRRSEKAEVLRVLDYGAGRGRLFSALAERVLPEELPKQLNYCAFEPFSDPNGVLGVLLLSAYGKESRPRVLSAKDQLEILDTQSIDVVVMCNVLHEIPPKEWVSLFGEGGIVTRLLARDGHILILEDMEMPHGELAHEYGFLLLDNPHLHKLFACTGTDSSTITSVDAYDGRLRAHSVPASLCGRTTHDTVVAALTLLQKTAREKVVALRTSTHSAKNGRLHALWTQLLANADIGLSELK